MSVRALAATAAVTALVAGGCSTTAGTPTVPGFESTTLADGVFANVEYTDPGHPDHTPTTPLSVGIRPEAARTKALPSPTAQVVINSDDLPPLAAGGKYEMRLDKFTLRPGAQSPEVRQGGQYASRHGVELGGLGGRGRSVGGKECDGGGVRQRIVDIADQRVVVLDGDRPDTRARVETHVIEVDPHNVRTQGGFEVVHLVG